MASLCVTCTCAPNKYHLKACTQVAKYSQTMQQTIRALASTTWGRLPAIWVAGMISAAAATGAVVSMILFTAAMAAITVYVHSSCTAARMARSLPQSHV